MKVWLTCSSKKFLSCSALHLIPFPFMVSNTSDTEIGWKKQTIVLRFQTKRVNISSLVFLGNFKLVTIDEFDKLSVYIVPTKFTPLENSSYYRYGIQACKNRKKVNYSFRPIFTDVNNSIRLSYLCSMAN